ncbi:Mpv17/PMP22 family protein [Biscogniauxia mediterranea]|nr:Mpv17/PMP22 family protein [Biscogniauxia mediterranea]
MALPPIVTATIQSAILAATSNILAQCLTAYQSEAPLTIDWVPVFQFILYAFLNVPPNFLWQELLESSFPAYHMAPTSEAVASASAGDEKELEKEAQEGRLVEPKLNITNTVIKLILDQTVGAAANTILLSLFMHSIQDAMLRPAAGPLSGAENSFQYLISPGAVDYAAVDWSGVLERSKAEFWPLLVTSWKLWPLVSLINYVFVKTIEGRNLVGSLAGVVWGIYLSMMVAQ